MSRTAVVVGGGAAGFFGAIRAKELAPEARVILLEATRAPLQKVRISGGGRCNVTHHVFDPAQLVTRYPRGAKELRGALAKFGPRETMAWFEARGVALKVEEDNRVFPTSDSSETICQALLDEAARLGVEVRMGDTVTSAARDPPAWSLTLKSGEALRADALLLASGSNPNGLALAAKLGHTVIPGVPSLFTFDVKDERIDGLQGLSVPQVRASLMLGPKPIVQEGPILITHWGLSAHAVLRLSAWGARELHDAGYKAKLVIDWLPGVSDDALRARATEARAQKAGGTMSANSIAPELPKRLWLRLLWHAGGDPQMRWSDVPNRGIQSLLDELKRGSFEIQGKGPFKEEFVTAGGVARDEVDWRTMESRRAPGVFFAGEVIDVDALTGGFNLQNAWTTGWLAGGGMAARLQRTEIP